MKMTSQMALDVALDVLTKYHENEGLSYSIARVSAYAYLLGALGASVSPNKANQILEMVFNEYSPKEKVGA
jgi:hypothetical protein